MKTQFYIWEALGLLMGTFLVLMFFRIPGRVAPGLILMVLAWIGGVLFFGIAVLMAQTKL